MDAGDALLVGAASLALVPFIGRLRRVATMTLIFAVKWAASAALVSGLVALTKDSPTYAALKSHALSRVQGRL